MVDRPDLPTLDLLEIDLDPPAATSRQPPPPERRYSSVAVVATLAVVLSALAAGWIVARPGTARSGATDPPPGAAGLAELFVTLYVTVDDVDRRLALLQLFPQGTDISPGPHHRFVNQAYTVDIAPAPVGGDPGATNGQLVWVATVTADVLVADGPDAPYRFDGLHHYQVAMVETSRGPAFTGLPVRIDDPPPPSIPPSDDGGGPGDDSAASRVRSEHVGADPGVHGDP